MNADKTRREETNQLRRLQYRARKAGLSVRKRRSPEPGKKYAQFQVLRGSGKKRLHTDEWTTLGRVADIVVSEEDKKGRTRR